MKSIPPHIRHFFWDADLSQINAEEKRSYIIERILELGDLAAVTWLFSNYPKDEIEAVLKKSRKISAKSYNFWKTILDI
jgi:hypothetical protein